MCKRFVSDEVQNAEDQDALNLVEKQDEQQPVPPSVDSVESSLQQIHGWVLSIVILNGSILLQNL